MILPWDDLVAATKFATRLKARDASDLGPTVAMNECAVVKRGSMVSSSRASPPLSGQLNEVSTEFVRPNCRAARACRRRPAGDGTGPRDVPAESLADTMPVTFPPQGT